MNGEIERNLKYIYAIDIELSSYLSRQLKLKQVEGQMELISSDKSPQSAPLTSKLIHCKEQTVIIVGAGPSGLFAALELCSMGYKPIIIERGQPVEIRGRDIGALFNRKILNPDSNLCYGEGGAGTWSDGKLTTRIGKNSQLVRQVLSTLVTHGASPRILVDGKPHLGTDKLVKILQSMRKYLISQGVIFHFDTKVDDFKVLNNKILGVSTSTGQEMFADKVILAIGHSSRVLYEKLIELGVHVEAKPIAVGFRVEHPQSMLNSFQYGAYGDLCLNGKGKIPVADYRLTTEVNTPLTDGERSCYSFCMCPVSSKSAIIIYSLIYLFLLTREVK